MAFRIPYALLNKQQKLKIETDLCLKEKANNYWGYKRGQAPAGKEINFYTVDRSSDQIDILLPMYYAGELLESPIPNTRILYSKIAPFKLHLSLRDYQQEVVNTSLRNFMCSGTTFLNVFCSFGKTIVAAFFAAMFSQKYGLTTLVTYPNTSIGGSWVDAFRNHTSAKVYVVGEETAPPAPDVQVFLCMGTRLGKLTPEVRKTIGHFVIDEADCYCTSGYVEGLLSIEPMFITLLTATYERDDNMHRMLDLMAGPERITRISKKPFFVFHVPTGFEVAEPRVGPRGIIFDSVVQHLDSIPERNTMIVKLVLANINEKMLVMTMHVEHAENLYAWLTHYLQAYGKTVSKYCGNMKEYDDADVTVGTLKKIGRGFDQKSCRDWDGRRFNVAILASSTKKIEQPAGRPLRADIPVIFDLVDNQRNCKAHWTTRKKWYESRNGQLYTVKEGLCWAEHRERMLKDYFEKLESGETSISGPQKMVNATADISKQHALSLLAHMAQ